jgi:thioredoxin-related protein
MSESGVLCLPFPAMRFPGSFGMVKSALALLCVFAACAIPKTAAAMTPPSADTLIRAAEQTAKAQNKIVLVHFGASWCSWCKRLDEMLEGKDLGRLVASHYVLVHLTVQESDDKKGLENPGAEDLLALNGAGKSGVPVFMFFDGNGKKIADSLALPNRTNIGYPESPEEIRAFYGILQITAPHMTEGERSRIIDYLKKQAAAH